MIIEIIVTIVLFFVNLLLSVLPDLSTMSEQIVTTINEYLDLIIGGGADFVAFFLPMDTLKIVLPIALSLIFFEKIWSLILWVLKKIPFLNIQ